MSETATATQAITLNPALWEYPVIAPSSLYPLDQTEVTVVIKAGKHTLSHKLRKPTLSELVERENDSFYETEAVSDTEEKVNAEDEQANARLWDKIAISVRGYKISKGDSIADALPVTDELKKLIPASHKAMAIRSAYQYSAEIEAGEDEGFVLSGDTWTIKQVIGDPDAPQYVIRHILKTPTEQQRREFRRRSADVRFSKGLKRLKTKVVTHLKAYVELYDALLVALDGVSFNGQSWQTFTAKTAEEMGAMVRAVDPIWKRSAIDALMRGFEASASD